MLPPLSAEPLSPEALDAIHDHAMRILEDVGIEVGNADLRDLLARAGQRVEGERVRLDAGFVAAQVALAPSSFVLHGRDPSRVVPIGGGSLARTPTGGAPFAADGDRPRHDGTLADHVELVRLAHASDVLEVMQSGTVEAQDLPETSRHLEMDYSIIRWSGRPLVLYGTSGPKMRDGIALAAIAGGGHDAIAERPAVVGIVNPNSPLVWDELMADALVACAETAQPVAVTPFLLAGASAPVSLAGGLALLVAEALSGVAMAQLVRPGTPCLFGSFFSGVDMRSGGPSLGTPESVLAVLAGGQLARRYGLPYRGGGGLTSANALDAQAATESAMSLWATYLAGSDLVLHAAGWLEGGLTASYEKLALDVDVLRMLDRLRAPVGIGPDDFALDAITEVGPGGMFLAHEHTLARFRELFMSPLFRSQAYPTWQKAGAPTTVETAGREWRRLLEAYEDPGIDPALDEELRAFIDGRARELDAT